MVLGFVAAIALAQASAQPASTESQHAADTAAPAAEKRPPSPDFVRGFHGIASLGFEALPEANRSAPFATIWITTLRARPRFGLELGSVPLVLGVDAQATYSVTAPYHLGVQGVPDPEGPPPFGWADLDVSAASPSALRTPDRRWSLTPFVYASIPLHVAPLALITHLGGAVRGEYTGDRLRIGVTAEAYRNIWPLLQEPTGQTDSAGNEIYVCRADQVTCAVSPQLPHGDTSVSTRAEFWLLSQVSVAGSLGFSHTFRDQPGVVGTSLFHPVYVTNYVHAGVDATYRFHRFAGVSVSARILRPIIGPSQPGDFVIAESAAWVGISVFARTDETLEPAWLTP